MADQILENIITALKTETNPGTVITFFSKAAKQFGNKNCSIIKHISSPHFFHAAAEIFMCSPYKFVREEIFSFIRDTAPISTVPTIEYTNKFLSWAGVSAHALLPISYREDFLRDHTLDLIDSIHGSAPMRIVLSDTFLPMTLFVVDQALSPDNTLSSKARQVLNNMIVTNGSFPFADITNVLLPRLFEDRDFWAKNNTPSEGYLSKASFTKQKADLLKFIFSRNRNEHPAITVECHDKILTCASTLKNDSLRTTLIETCACIKSHSPSIKKQVAEPERSLTYITQQLIPFRDIA